MFLRPVECGSDSEQARRSYIFQDGYESLELTVKASTSSWVEKSHCEGFISLRLSIQNCPDLQHLKQQHI